MLEKDLAEAFNWYKKSAVQGFSRAQRSLAYCYLFGEGIDKDAARYYDMWIEDLKSRNGAEDNELLASHYFSLERFETAADYYHRAIQLGSKNSKANLDQCLAKIPLLRRIKWKAQHRS